MEHDHSNSGNKKILMISFLIITTYMIVEVIGGIMTNSLALLSDAGHMLSDAISLGVALLAFSLGAKSANKHKTYGYKRFEILAVVFNGVTLILVSLFIFYEAIQRFQNPPEVTSIGMLIIASIGLLVNVLIAWIMNRGGDVKDNLNMRGAYLHVLSDILGSIGAIIAALIIIFFDWHLADPIASIIVAILVLRSGYSVLKSGIHVLMEGTPKNVNIDNVIKIFESNEDIESIHDLHIWSITSELNILSCHVIISEKTTIDQSQQLLHKLEKELENQNIQHMTIQLEASSHLHDNAIFCNTEVEVSGHHH